MYLAHYKPDENRLVDEITRRALEHGIVEVLEEFFVRPEKSPAEFYKSTPRLSPLWATSGCEPLHRLTGKDTIRASRWWRLVALAEDGNWAELEKELRRPFIGQAILKYRTKPSVRTLVAATLALCPILITRIDTHAAEIAVTHNKGEWAMSLEADCFRDRRGKVQPVPPGEIEWDLMFHPIEPTRLPHVAAALRGLLMVDDPYLEVLLTWYCAYKTGSTTGWCIQPKGGVKLRIRRPAPNDLIYQVADPQPIGVSGWWETKAMGKSRSIRELYEATLDLREREVIPVNVLEIFNHHVVFGNCSPERFQDVIGKARRVVNKGVPGVWPVSAGTIRRWYFQLCDY